MPYHLKKKKKNTPPKKKNTQQQQQQKNNLNIPNLCFHGEGEIVPQKAIMLQILKHLKGLEDDHRQVKFCHAISVPRKIDLNSQD